MKMLVAVDLARDPWAVVDAAAAYATRLGARIDLIFVEDVPAIAGPAADPELQALLQVRRDQVLAEHKATLEHLLSRLPESIRGEALLASGPIADEIVARSPRYHTLVVWTHGRTGLAHFWLGSVAERVVRLARCAVLVLRHVEDVG